MILRILAVLMGLAAAGLIGVLLWSRQSVAEWDEPDENGWAAA